MRIKLLTTGFMAALLLLGSCSTPKDITYFQDMYNGAIVDPTRQLDIRVEPENKLSIVVSTQDPALSSLFNLVTSSNRIGAASSSTGSTNGQTSLYTVDPQGYINFPVLGRLHVAGMSRHEVASYIEKKLQDSDLVKDPIVTVEFANTGISILGDVTKPGRYEFNKDHLTIVDAIAMAGDLSLSGMRENVLVMRTDDYGKQQAYRIDLTDLNTLAQSPVYYLQQDDVIYVEPSDKRKRETTALGNSPFTPSFWISLVSSALTITTLLITLSKK